jgi:hypothetical protein
VLVLQGAALCELRQRRPLHATRVRERVGEVLGVSPSARLAPGCDHPPGVVLDLGAPLMPGPWRISPDDPFWIEHWRKGAAALRAWASESRAKFGELAGDVATLQEANAAALEQKAIELEAWLKVAGKGASNGNPDINC